MLREPPRPAWERLLGLRASKEWSARFGTLERARQPMIFLGGLPIGARAVKRRCENMPAIEVVANRARSDVSPRARVRAREGKLAYAVIRA